MKKLVEDDGGGCTCGNEGSGGIGDFTPEHMIGGKKPHQVMTPLNEEDFKKIFESIQRKPAHSYYRNISLDMKNDDTLLESIIIEFLPTANCDKRFWTMERDSCTNGKGVRQRKVHSADNITLTSNDPTYAKEIRIQLLKDVISGQPSECKYYCSVENMLDDTTIQYSGDWMPMRVREAEQESDYDRIFREGRKEFDALFTDGDALGTLDFQSPFLVLSFDAPFFYNNRSNFVSGDWVSREIFTPTELTSLKRIGISGLPCTIRGENKLREVYDFIREK